MVIKSRSKCGVQNNLSSSKHSIEQIQNKFKLSRSRIRTDRAEEGQCGGAQKKVTSISTTPKAGATVGGVHMRGAAVRRHPRIRRNMVRMAEEAVGS
jgi:hypothetical protein